jgi:hypothetical protein
MDNPLNNKDEYESNGWSKYQMLVLAQLQEHKELFKSLMNDVNQIKQKDAIDEVTFKHWKAMIDQRCLEIEKEMAEVVHAIGKDDDGLEYRLDEIEDAKKTEEKVDLKMKGVWAAIGGGVIIAINVIIKLIEVFVMK